VHALQRRALPAVHLENDLLRPVEPGLVVADGRRWHQRAIRPDRRDLDHRRVERPKKALPRHRRDLAEVHVEILHLAAVDLLPRNGVRIVGQTELDPVGPGERAVQFRPGRRAGPDPDPERVPGGMLRLDPGGKRQRNGLGVARPGKAAHSDGAARANQPGRVVRAHHPRTQPLAGGSPCSSSKSRSGHISLHRYPPNRHQMGTGICFISNTDGLWLPGLPAPYSALLTSFIRGSAACINVR